MKFKKIEKGHTKYEQEVWNLKERIRKEESILNQSRRYFARTYRQQDAYLYLNKQEVIGFGLVRSDGYISLLGVKKEKRDQGIGKKLINKIEDDHERISCHTRSSNKNAINFYQNLGFELKRTVDGYYKDGDTAYYLVKGKKDIKNKIKDIFRI
ncbi:MAG: GNAT family N-acetyltransferase [archaeon]